MACLLFLLFTVILVQTYSYAPPVKHEHQAAGNVLCFDRAAQTRGEDSYQACCLHDSNEVREKCWTNGRSFDKCCYSAPVSWRRHEQFVQVHVNQYLLAEMIGMGEAGARDFFVEDKNLWMGNNSIRLYALDHIFDNHPHKCIGEHLYTIYATFEGDFGLEKNGPRIPFTDTRPYCILKEMPLEVFVSEVLLMEFYSERFEPNFELDSIRKHDQVLYTITTGIMDGTDVIIDEMDTTVPTYGTVGKRYAPPTLSQQKEYVGLYRSCGECELVLEGLATDGGYVMCKMDEHSIKAIYSYGIHTEDNWGVQYARKHSAQLHEYDCFADIILAQNRSNFGINISFHDECVGGNDYTSKNIRRVRSLSSQLRQNGHEHWPESSWTN